MYRILLPLTLVPQLALAGVPSLDPSWDGPQLSLGPDEPEFDVATVSGPERPFDMEAGIRVRALSLPRSILSTRFTEGDDDGWPLADEDRPNVRATSYGLEFVLKWEVSNLFLYFDYMDVNWEAGYWDDRDDDFEDGSYVVPTNNFGIAAFGCDYAAEVHLIETANTNGGFGMSLLLGAGLGIGFVTGQVDWWGATDNSELRGWEKYELGEDPTEQANIPLIIPVVDINAGLRFNIADRTALRVEGGLHDLLYIGGSVAVML